MPMLLIAIITYLATGTLFVFSLSFAASQSKLKPDSPD